LLERGKQAAPQRLFAIPPCRRGVGRFQDPLRLRPVARPSDGERAQSEGLDIGRRVGAIAFRQRIAQGGEPGGTAYLCCDLLQQLARQRDDVAHAACRTSGSVSPCLAATSVARFMKSWRISSLVRCLMCHLRKISLFFDFEPPKKDGR